MKKIKLVKVLMYCLNFNVIIFNKKHFLNKSEYYKHTRFTGMHQMLDDAYHTK